MCFYNNLKKKVFSETVCKIIYVQYNVCWYDMEYSSEKFVRRRIIKSYIC